MNDFLDGAIGDLLVLTADADAAEAIRTLLQERYKSLGIRKITFKIIRHPNRDNGVFHGGHELLRGFQNQYRYALAICDHHGSGAENQSIACAANDLRDRLRINGWGDRAEAVVISPELEIWVWGVSNQISKVLGWNKDTTDLRKYLVEQHLLDDPNAKPKNPKTALHAVLQKTRTPTSQSIFSQLAKKVSLKGCEDKTFLSFVEALRRWFPVVRPQK